MGSVLHADFLTTMQYIDQAVLHALRRQKEALFAPLPAALLEAARGGASPTRTRATARTEKKARGGDPAAVVFKLKSPKPSLFRRPFASASERAFHPMAVGGASSEAA
jgi:hypothetical protein